MNKPITAAIAAQQPMHWELTVYHYAGDLALIAVTFTMENGDNHTKVVARTFDLDKATAMCDEIRAAGGRVDGDVLTKIREKREYERRDWESRSTHSLWTL
jgi:hypothetical protein